MGTVTGNQDNVFINVYVDLAFRKMRCNIRLLPCASGRRVCHNAPSLIVYNDSGAIQPVSCTLLVNFGGVLTVENLNGKDATGVRQFAVSPLRRHAYRVRAGVMTVGRRTGRGASR